MTVHSSQDFDHWNHTVHAVCGRFVTQRADVDDAFVGTIQPHDLGGLNVADIHINASSIKRERGSLSRADDRFYFLILQRQGVMAINQTQEQFVLHPGELALFDSSQAFEMLPQGLVNQLSVHLNRDAVERVLPPSARRFAKLEQHSLSANLLRGLLQQIAKGHLQPVADTRDGNALQDALINLLQPTLPSLSPESGRPLRRLAERLINDALPEAPSPTQLAASLNVSVRQLYRQFEMDGESICRYIQRQRLERSARELADDAAPITSIAYKWGFTDSAHFSRTFKRHFGASPREYRLSQLKDH
ncbi:transcriptional regulator FeaR [Pseudomonas sp. LRF_L74]|uniref:transcriptional regulator FeaR n=1 Tax=Pseudomonas sp. LRF_L74 TaxID=3369422 RepID=UPI003F6292EB